MPSIIFSNNLSQLAHFLWCEMVWHGVADGANTRRLRNTIWVPAVQYSRLGRQVITENCLCRGRS